MLNLIQQQLTFVIQNKLGAIGVGIRFNVWKLIYFFSFWKSKQIENGFHFASVRIKKNYLNIETNIFQINIWFEFSAKSRFKNQIISTFLTKMTKIWLKSKNSTLIDQKSNNLKIIEYIFELNHNQSEIHFDLTSCNGPNIE